MMGEPIELELPSGRKIKVRRPTLADMARVNNGRFPDVLAIQQMGSGRTLGNITDLMVRLVCEVSVEPRFYYDDRSSLERLKGPVKLPAGVIEYDLDVPDGQMAANKVSEWLQEDKQTYVPTSETQTN